MMNLLKHSNNKIFFAFFVLFIFFGCSKEERKSNEIVRIRDAVLTEDELNIALGEKSNNTKLREQFINEWIEREVLYQKAIEEGITEDKEFNSILERSKKELAAAFLINKILSENTNSPDEVELRDYYELLKEDFRLLDDLYRINIIYFNNFDDAVKFRTILIESGWDKALNAFANTSSIISSETNSLYYGYQLQPASLARIISFMLPGEISIVIEAEKNKYAVVQLEEKFDKGIIPPFEVIKEKVKERYQVIKNKEFIQNYIEELISDYDVEIKR
ncbi:MAG: peptidyl-prolyl cis-trans isomerase [Melioribacter sp.]|uniref:peptidylprolyl isomerase n=1 Tax=Rosettibacter primus TaxID=3111523 RepID=UPI00247CAC16|nr:peptidyl-prolyl cis-trans isomerase [Melioribacter sp.]